MTARAKKRKASAPYRVYVTYLPDGRYYIGYSHKVDKLFETYYGSSREIIEHIRREGNSNLTKEVIAEFSTKSHAKVQEFLLQWNTREDPRCINDMIHLRLRMSHLKEFIFVKWEPREGATKNQLLTAVS